MRRFVRLPSFCVDVSDDGAKLHDLNEVFVLTETKFHGVITYSAFTSSSVARLVLDSATAWCALLYLNVNSNFLPLYARPVCCKTCLFFGETAGSWCGDGFVAVAAQTQCGACGFNQVTCREGGHRCNYLPVLLKTREDI